MDYNVIIAIIITFTLTHVAWTIGLCLIVNVMSKNSVRCRCTLAHPTHELHKPERSASLNHGKLGGPCNREVQIVSNTGLEATG